MSNASSSSIKQYWLCQLLFWGVFTLINFGFASLWPPIDNVDITVTLIAVTGFIGTSHLLRTLYKRLAYNWAIFKILLASIIVIPISGFVVQALIYVVIQIILETAPILMDGMVAYSWRNYTLYAMNSMTTLAIWSIVYISVVQFRSRRNTETAYWKTQAQLRDSELRFLHNQINSHFLFNAMNNVRALILENPTLARERLTQLANILRATLAANDSELIPLAQELDIVKAYLDLESLQYESRMHVNIDIDPDIAQTKVPPMALQTLVENAVKHGISQNTATGIISIRGEIVNEDISILISNPISSNNSNGHSDGHTGHGIGLHNTQERLEKAFGDRAKLVSKRDDNIFCVQILLPL